MITLKSGTRLIQTLKNKRKNQYSLTNIFLNFDCTINHKAANVIKEISKLNNLKKEQKILKKYGDFVESLKKIGIIVDSSEVNDDYKTYIMEKPQRLPLSCFNIELTNGCNLRCIHCYGKFGDAKTNIQLINKEKLINLIPELNLLNCKAVSFTGGESTMHPDFLEIVEAFIKNGFEISIFTNGFNFQKIVELVNKYPNFPFILKISIDGFKETHDKIRGRAGSYEKVIKLLDFLATKKSVDTYLSNTIMKCNIDEVNDFEKVIKEKYPTVHFNKDLIFPLGNGLEQSFSVKEFETVFKKCPSVFNSSEKQDKILRCSGGVSQCTLTPDGRLKICNGACDERFFFKNNVFDVGIITAWYDCGQNIMFYRKEKNKTTQKCKQCKLKNKCFLTDCRILALGYCGDEKQPNPMVCFSVKNKK